MRARTCMGSGVMSVQSSRTRPLSGRHRPITILNDTDLPAPLGPNSPTISAWCTEKETSCTTCRVLNVLLSAAATRRFSPGGDSFQEIFFSFSVSAFKVYVTSCFARSLRAADRKR